MMLYLNVNHSWHSSSMSIKFAQRDANSKTDGRVFGYEFICMADKLVCDATEQT